MNILKKRQYKELVLPFLIMILDIARQPNTWSNVSRIILDIVAFFSAECLVKSGAMSKSVLGHIVC